MFNSFDIDGVIYMGDGKYGVKPHYDDIIITGRSHEESVETKLMLRDVGIHNKVFYNPVNFDAKTRFTSGIHKASILNKFKGDINIHFEDDPIQIKVIKDKCPWLNVVWLDHDLTQKENIRHVFEISKPEKA
tara:strand:+ start:286 stop:681 length:396 start_codon:yes stop_codon:yes gene_type:complete